MRENTVVDGFQVWERLHVGGMATLWRVTRDDAATPIVMKVPTSQTSDDPAAIVGFEMEQMILPLLSGPHVPAFVASGDFDGQPYLVMEYVAGESLLPRFDAAPLPIEDVVAIGMRTAEALNDLHRQHVIHLDIKPSNVMMRASGEAVLIDFGLSRHERMPDLLAEELRLPIGTGPYISPEQIGGDRTDPRSDIFSLGVLLYHLITRQRPFGYPRSHRALRRRLWRDPVPPRAITPACPAWLQEVVLRCLEPAAADRYPTAAQLAFDLKNPDGIAPSARGERLEQDGRFQAFKRWYETGAPKPARSDTIARRLALAPIVMAAIDLEAAEAPSEALRAQIERVLSATPGVRLACVNIMRTNRIALNYVLDSEGRNIHLQRLTELRLWARALRIGEAQVTFHVLEAPDPAAALLDYARVNHVDHILIGARARFARNRLLGGVARRVVVEAPCTVTVVREGAGAPA